LNIKIDGPPIFFPTASPVLGHEEAAEQGTGEKVGNIFSTAVPLVFNIPIFKEL
jgi:hypothetical protein